MEEKYTITLNTGKMFSDLTMNGDMYVSRTEVKKSDFDGITRAVIAGNGAETHINGAVCDAVLHWPEGYLFNIREKTKSERDAESIEAIEAALVELAGIIAGED